MKTINHIVIIDDNKIDCFINQNIIGHAFNKSSTKIFNSAVNALDYFRKTSKSSKVLPLFTTDLILLDINMPVMSGFEFLKKLALTTDFIKNPIDVYFLSSSNNEKDISDALEIKFCSGYIIKPLTKEKLINALEMKIKKNRINTYCQLNRKNETQHL